MTSLPTGLAHHASRLDDVPQVRGAVAFCKAHAERDAERRVKAHADPLTEAIDRHAALAIGSAYRAQDRR